MVSSEHNNKLVQIMAVDNLPSVLPKESSEDFSNQLLPHLVDIVENDQYSSVWKSAHQTFQEHLDRA